MAHYQDSNVHDYDARVDSNQVNSQSFNCNFFGLNSDESFNQSNLD